MGTINSAFSLMTQALDADQAALNIVANNVANANTPGYTEEQPTWQENQPITINGVSYGEGVTETGPASQRDRVLEERLDQQQQLASASSTRLTALDSIQALFTPDSGSSSSSTAGDIGSDITSFFDSLSSLANSGDPTDDAQREDVLSAASTLAGDISSAAASLNAQRSALDQEASGTVSQINALTGAIAQLNQQIQSISPDSDAGTLEDQRQEDISQLSQLVGINQVTTENNGLSITTTSGQLLVSEGASYQLTTGTVNGVTDFFLGGTDITSDLSSGGGELGGYLTARDTDIPSALNSLDQLAYNISTSVNALNNEGTDADGVEGTGTNSADVTGTGTTPLYIFNEPTQVAGSAAAMSVVMTDSSQIAAAAFGAGTGDSSNAASMGDLASRSIVGAAATTEFSVTQNLDSTTSVKGTVTSNIEIYDSLGNAYQATVTYTNEGSNTWIYSITVPGATSTNASGTLDFDPTTGDLTPPAGSVGSITFSGLSDGAAPLNLTWNLSGITQSTAASAQTGQSQNGSSGETPINYYSNFVSTLGSTVSEVQTENTAQNASVTQLQTQNDALSSVNLNDEASAMTTLERSYQAASQVFTMLNTVMAAALNLGDQTAVS